MCTITVFIYVSFCAGSSVKRIEHMGNVLENTWNVRLAPLFSHLEFPLCVCVCCFWRHRGFTQQKEAFIIFLSASACDLAATDLVPAAVTPRQRKRQTHFIFPFFSLWIRAQLCGFGAGREVWGVRCVCVCVCERVTDEPWSRGGTQEVVVDMVMVIPSWLFLKPPPGQRTARQTTRERFSPPSSLRLRLVCFTRRRCRFMGRSNQCAEGREGIRDRLLHADLQWAIVLKPFSARSEHA